MNSQIPIYVIPQNYKRCSLFFSNYVFQLKALFQQVDKFKLKGVFVNVI